MGNVYEIYQESALFPSIQKVCPHPHLTSVCYTGTPAQKYTKGTNEVFGDTSEVVLAGRYIFAFWRRFSVSVFCLVFGFSSLQDSSEYVHTCSHQFYHKSLQLSTKIG